MTRRHVLVVFVVLVLLGSVAGIVHSLAQSRAAEPAGSERADATASPRSDHQPSAAPFQGWQVAYAFHGFTGDELSRLRGAAPGAVPVVVREVAIDSGLSTYPVIPAEAMTASPDEYAAAVSDTALAASLREGAVLARTEAGLRGLDVGQSLRLADGRTVPVTAVVDDAVLGGNEMALPAQFIPDHKGVAATYALIPPGTDASIVQRAVGERAVRVKEKTGNGYLSADDTVLTQLQVKARFGEFALRPSASGSSFDQDPAYERQRLTYLPQVQQLGPVKCNRAVVGALKAAMKEITDRGLGATINTADFQYQGGCWNPSVVPLSGGSMSRHSWGIAIDFNIAANDLGAAPRQDPRLVAIMRKYGFAWGGDFLRPDGMHFEYVGTP